MSLRNREMASNAFQRKVVWPIAVFLGCRHEEMCMVKTPQDGGLALNLPSCSRVWDAFEFQFEREPSGRHSFLKDKLLMGA